MRKRARLCNCGTFLRRYADSRLWNGKWKWVTAAHFPCRSGWNAACQSTQPTTTAPSSCSNDTDVYCDSKHSCSTFWQSVCALPSPPHPSPLLLSPFQLYLQARLKVEWARLLRPTLQFFLIAATVYTGFSRVSDYKHHWSDVLCGLLQGALMAILVVSSGMFFGAHVIVFIFYCNEECRK